ncbi:MAG: carbohydrate-binding family 9-like protein [Acidobacteriota bacterium]
MKVKALWLLALLCPAILADRGSEIKDAPLLPEYHVQTVEDELQVDGRLSEPAWSRAQPLTLLFPWDSQTGKKQKTAVRVLCSRNLLYVGYECEDEDITAAYQRPDDPVYEDDCVEIFLRPNDDSGPYIGLEMNARGVLFDYFFPFPNDLDKKFDLEGAKLKTSLRGTLNHSADVDEGWSLELAIPFRNFSRWSQQLPPSKGVRWRAQINRWDGTQERGGRRLSMWCHSGLKQPDPHNPERFGFLIF